jgi:proteic killer suppression protein
VIGRIRHRGLRRLYDDEGASRVTADQVDRIRIILAALDAAQRPEDMNIHTFRLHALRGDLRGYWAVTVRANWRIIFRFVDGVVQDVDLLDYH